MGLEFYMLYGDKITSTTDIVQLLKWQKEEADGRLIKTIKRETTSDALVSTIFMPIDHGFCPGEPVVFETMVFGGGLDGYQGRYTSLKDAEEGHRKIVWEVVLKSSLWSHLVIGKEIVRFAIIYMACMVIGFFTGVLLIISQGN